MKISALGEDGTVIGLFINEMSLILKYCCCFIVLTFDSILITIRLQSRTYPLRRMVCDKQVFKLLQGFLSKLGDS